MKLYSKFLPQCDAYWLKCNAINRHIYQVVCRYQHLNTWAKTMLWDVFISNFVIQTEKQ